MEGCNMRTTNLHALGLSHVSKTYGQGQSRVQVLNDINLSADVGELVWIRGESGSGKSSLIRIAGLLSKPTSGSVLVDGCAAWASSNDYKLRHDRIGVVFQYSNLLQNLTVYENVSIALHQSDNARVVDILQSWGLDSVSERLGKEVSGGQAQRVALCRALINNPKVLLLDEPTSGLDPDNAALVMKELLRAKNENRLTIIASHDARMETVASRVLTMKGGRLV